MRFGRLDGLRVLATLGSLAIAAGFIACLGDDPAASTAESDAATPSADGGPPANAEAGGTSCIAPLEACGVACVDKQSTDQHCGRCNRACGPGSSCSAGRCSSVTLASALDTPHALGVSTGVVVLGVKDGLVRCGKDGCNQGVTRLWVDTGWGLVERAFALSPDGSEAFALARAAPPGSSEVNLYRAAVDGTPPLVPSSETPLLAPAYILGTSIRVAADEREFAFLSPYHNDRCFRGSCSSVAGLSEGETPSSITLTATHYAWTMVNSSATVQTCLRPPAGITSYEGTVNNCAAPLTLAQVTTQNATDHITSHANVLYWAEWNRTGGATASILACAPTGCGGTPKVIATAEQVVDGLVVDASGAYWTNGSTGTVRVCRDLVNGCGTSAETLASGATSPGPIALDDTFAYYVARGASATAGVLLKVAK